MRNSAEVWKERWREDQLRLHSEGRFRTLGRGGDAPFCHNDYLGLRRDPRVLDAIREAIDNGLPTTSTGSRLLSGNLPLFEQFEDEFAKAAGFPASLLFGSASEANRVVLATLVGRHDTVFHDELAHASLIDGIVQSGAKRIRFRHNDPADLRAQLASPPSGGIRVVVTESVFSMDGDRAPLAEILAVCESEGAMLVIDEAHAVGVYGERRTGLAEALPRSPCLIATTHGFGKALASSGGILCTVPEVAQAIHNRSRAFIFTTAPSPLTVVAARSAWDVSRQDPDLHTSLWERCQQLHAGLKQLGWPVSDVCESPIFPLRCGGLAEAVALAERLQKRGIPLRPIRPPTVPSGSERLRATVSAEMGAPMIESFLEILRDV